MPRNSESRPARRFSKRGLLAALSKSQRGWLSETLRNETAGGALLLVSALTALVIANGPLQD